MVIYFVLHTIIAFLGVLLAFILKKPGFFLKQPNGTLSSISYLIFWPYFILNTISFGLFRFWSRENRLDEIIPNLYIGSLLWKKDYESFALLGIKSTLDLTAEFGEVDFLRTQPNYRCLPLLDTSAPSLPQLEEAIQWITEQLLKGPVFVHCALGHGRSATIIAGFLMKQWQVADVQEAVEWISAKRVGVHLNSRQWNLLEKYRASLILND